jgi:phosphoribosylaminoimidazolecarboxamide formyltransferase/IMP cyclohydrolase
LKRALLSVTNKSGLVEFAKGLSQAGFNLISTGGTAKALSEAQLEVTEVGKMTGFPELMDGRLKTLHPLVHGGLLGDPKNPIHHEQMVENNIKPIDLLCVNLYAFEETISRHHSREEAIESIDIGGPAMIRAAAKNYANVLVVTDPDDYDRVLDAVAANNVGTLRTELAAKAFRHTAYYDSVIAGYLTRNTVEDRLTHSFPVALRRQEKLRYGENPHQEAAVYRDPLATGGIVLAEQLWGKQISYNNYLDADAAWNLACDLPEGACAVIKHGNPCGAAVGKTGAESYALARQSDPISAFGGIAAFYGVLDEATAAQMTESGNFLEVVIALDFEPEALDVFRERSGWGKNVRLLKSPKPATQKPFSVRSVGGGALVQEVDFEPDKTWEQAGEHKPDPELLESLRFAWKVVKHVKSNAIVVCKGKRLLGTGAGQMNRVQSVRLALEQAGEEAQGAVLASDAFFPFGDSIKTAGTAGIRAVVQPGGSKKDVESIEAANEMGIAMMFTGVRHFRH